MVNSMACSKWNFVHILPDHRLEHFRAPDGTQDKEFVARVLGGQTPRLRLRRAYRWMLEARQAAVRVPHDEKWFDSHHHTPADSAPLTFAAVQTSGYSSAETVQAALSTIRAMMQIAMPAAANGPGWKARRRDRIGDHG